MRSRHIQLTLRIAFFIIFLFILYRLIDLNLLKGALRQVRIEIVCLAVFVYFFNIGIRAYRLQTILNHNEKRIRLKDAYIVTLIGIALNILVPATLGDIARSYYGYKIYGIKEEMLSTTLIDKIFALCSLFLLGTISGYITKHYLLGLVSLGAAIVTFIPLTIPNIIPWNIVNTILRQFKKSLETDKLLATFNLPYTQKAFIIIISLAGWLATCVYFYILCSAFPVTVNLGYIIVIMPIITIVRLFPFTVNALGPTEVAVAYFFNLIGINPTLAVLISLSSNIIASIIPGILGFIIILLYGHDIKKSPKHSLTK